mmetsp:Transcript_12943/g.33164  ORF Transcript_12943/g.33164 Transcript_12943/m.33164 type:complete len:206 (+) Transcript_12943:168-785(+)
MHPKRFGIHRRRSVVNGWAYIDYGWRDSFARKLEQICPALAMVNVQDSPISESIAWKHNATFPKDRFDNFLLCSMIRNVPMLNQCSSLLEVVANVNSKAKPANRQGELLARSHCHADRFTLGAETQIVVFVVVRSKIGFFHACCGTCLCEVPKLVTTLLTGFAYATKVSVLSCVEHTQHLSLQVPTVMPDEDRKSMLQHVLLISV